MEGLAELRRRAKASIGVDDDSFEVSSDSLFRASPLACPEGDRVTERPGCARA
jgi:hypothetical protein